MVRKDSEATVRKMGLSSNCIAGAGFMLWLCPGKLDGLLHVRVEALMHGAGVRRFFEGLPMGFADRIGHMDFDGEFLNPAYGGVHHLFFDGRGGSGEVDFERTGCDAHHREDAATEGGCDQIGRRKTLAASLIVLGGVGGEDGSGGAVNCLAVQILPWYSSWMATIELL